MKKYFLLSLIVLLVLAFVFSCTPLNKAPVWKDAPYEISGTVGVLLEFDLSDKVSDPDGDPVSITIVRGTGATIENGVFKFTPSEAKTYTFVLEASDGKGGKNTATLVINVSIVPNNAPVWSASSYTGNVNKGELFIFDLSDKVNDPDGDEVEVTIEGNTRGATIEGKVFNWNTSAITEGSYSFLLKARDSKGAFSYATLEISVQPAVIPNRPPVVLPLQIQNLSTKVGKEVSINLKDYVSDPDGDAVQITKVSGPGAIVGTKYVWFPETLMNETSVTLKFSDGKGGEVTKTFKVSATIPGTGNLTIYITDYKSGPATSGATVKLMKNGSLVSEQTTDSSGKVVFNNITLNTTTDFDIIISKNGYAKTYIEGLRLKDGETIEFETQMRVAKLGPTSSDKPFELEYVILDEMGRELVDNVVSTDGIKVLGTATSTEYTFNLWCVKVGGVPGAGTLTNPRVIGYSPAISALSSVKEFEGMVPVYVDLYDQNDNRYEKIIYLYVSRTPSVAITPYIVEKYTNAVPTGYNILAYTRRGKIEYYGGKTPSPTVADKDQNLYVRVYWRPWYSASGTTQPKAYKIYRSFDGTIFEPVATLPNNVYTYTDYSAKLEPNKKVWYAVSSVYDGYETPYSVVGSVIPLPMFDVQYISPVNGSTNVPRDPEFSWQFVGPTSTPEGNVTYIYDIWLYDLVVNDSCYYSISRALGGSYSIFGITPATQGNTVSFKFSDFTSGTYRWVDFAANTWYPYDKLQANKTYEWGNELLVARVIDVSDRTIAYAIHTDNNNYLGTGKIETDMYHRFVTGEN